MKKLVLLLLTGCSTLHPSIQKCLDENELCYVRVDEDRSCSRYYKNSKGEIEIVEKTKCPREL